MNPTPTPFPTFIAHNALEAEQIQLLSQIQHHALSVRDAYLFTIAFAFPGPLSWKFAIYHFLISLPFPQITPLQFVALITIGPIVSLILLYFIVRYAVQFFRFLLPLLVRLLLKKNIQTQKVFLELTFPANTIKSAYATEQLYKLLHTLSRSKTGMFGEKKTYSLEIVATRNEGIRYILVIPQKEKDIIHKSLISFLPGLKVVEISDYLSEIQGVFPKTVITDKKSLNQKKTIGVVELKLTSDFVLPLQNQKILSEHDSISFLTGNMTKLTPGELIAFQLITTPLPSQNHGKEIKHMRECKDRIYKGKPLEPLLKKNSFLSYFPSPLLLIFGIPVWTAVFLIKVAITTIGAFIQNDTKGLPFFEDQTNLQQILNPYEQELATMVKEKTSQSLFETSLRILILVSSEVEFDARVHGLTASLGQFTNSHQELTVKGTLLGFPTLKSHLSQFRNRVLSSGFGTGTNPILSTSELSDLYHFPYTDLTKTEGLQKSKSKDLPAPLSLKKSTTQLDVIVGKNIYGGEETPIGLSAQDRQGHTYIFGKTGSGKTTIIKNMALQDILSGKGVCVIDPHGDMVKELLRLIPKERIQDVCYFDPGDKEYPIGLNILKPGIQFSDIDEEHRFITNSLLSVFMKITPKDHWGQRMEHILRNATLTALELPTPTIDTPYTSLLTIQKLLTSTTYRRKVTPTITDPILRQFWDEEFKRYGSMQQASATSPLTNKLGEFFTDKLSRNILLQEKTTINIAEIMNEGKILLVNLSKGKLGEERSSFFGTFLTSLIQLATYSRENMKEEERTDFFVYIDEFQNFATHHFVDIFSEARKYHVFFTPSHQTIAQIEDVRIPNVISSNADTIIALKNGPADEQFILPFFTPEVEEGEIVNLPKYHFFMKATGGTEEDAYSGETIPLTKQGDEKIAEEVIAYTRIHYTKPKVEVEKQLQKLFGIQNTTEGTETKNVNFASQNSRIKKDMVSKAKRKKREKEGM